MFRPRKKRNEDCIPTASMADVAFLLLIFFLSTTRFDMKNGLGIVLPGPTTEETQRVRILDDNLTRILINRDGQVQMNNEVVSLQELETAVRQIVIQNPEMVFMLRTDRQSKYENMVNVLDRLRVAGAERINLSTN
ncbi:MAG: biopolymer transporter ExbD [Candidatus Cloacimonetes bacterium]|nr:biopolymer transporter ExbD [Candidatus Cloacimonadota bacterium]